QTNSQTGACLAPPASTVTITMNANATPTFAIFATATDNIAPFYAANRIFVRFTDATGNQRGATGVALRTQGYNPPLPPPLIFNPPTPPPPNGVVGQHYRFAFCTPYPAMGSLIQCPPPGSTPPFNPSGGNPPYHFQIDSGSGFPPIGCPVD